MARIRDVDHSMVAVPTTHIAADRTWVYYLKIQTKIFFAYYPRGLIAASLGPARNIVHHYWRQDQHVAFGTSVSDARHYYVRRAAPSAQDFKWIVEKEKNRNKQTYVDNRRDVGLDSYTIGARALHFIRLNFPSWLLATSPLPAIEAPLFSDARFWSIRQNHLLEYS